MCFHSFFGVLLELSWTLLLFFKSRALSQLELREYKTPQAWHSAMQTMPLPRPPSSSSGHTTAMVVPQLHVWRTPERHGIDDASEFFPCLAFSNYDGVIFPTAFGA